MEQQMMNIHKVMKDKNFKSWEDQDIKEVEKGEGWGIESEKYATMGTISKEVNPNIEPKHYTEMKISPLEYITKNEGEFTWCIANVIKYVSRYKRKNGLEDLKKASWYLNYQIEQMEKVK